MLINGMEFLVGCDPEVFIRRNGKFVCADGYVSGTKKKPQKIPNGMVQVDGMALEFGISPVKTKNGFIRRTTNVRRHIERMLPKDVELVEDASVIWDPDVWEKAPDTSKELGCDPDWNAYTGRLNPTPKRNDGEYLSTGAGHIHIGWGKNIPPEDHTHIQACQMLTMNLDYYLGVPAVLWEAGKDGKAQKRRSLYGRAGAFRPKPYGMEYRTLSNKWLSHPSLIGFVYDQTMLSIQKLFEGTWQKGSQNTVDIINNYDIPGALSRCEFEKIDWPKPPKERAYTWKMGG